MHILNEACKITSCNLLCGEDGSADPHAREALEVTLRHLRTSLECVADSKVGDCSQLRVLGRQLLFFDLANSPTRRFMTHVLLKEGQQHQLQLFACTRSNLDCFALQHKTFASENKGLTLRLSVRTWSRTAPSSHPLRKSLCCLKNKQCPIVDSYFAPWSNSTRSRMRRRA